MPTAIDAPPPIGSAAWDRELLALGVDRATVERELLTAVAEVAEPDGHDVYLNDSSPLTAAVLVLFHQRHPSYSSLMYLSFVWNEADGRLRDWIVRQYAAMLVHGPGPVADSAEYGLAVGHFEHHADAPVFLAGLVSQVPPGHWGGLLRASGAVPWPVKRRFFTDAAELPELHAPLASGIAASFYGVYGDVDAPEAAELLRRITVVDDRVRADLVEATTRPVLMRSGSAVVVTDARWAHPGSFLLEMTIAQGRWRWAGGSELVVGGETRGRVMHWDFPFRTEYEHRVVPGRTLEKAKLHRVEWPSADAAGLVDRELELWLPGLREYLGRP